MQGKKWGKLSISPFQHLHNTLKTQAILDSIGSKPQSSLEDELKSSTPHTLIGVFPISDFIHFVSSPITKLVLIPSSTSSLCWMAKDTEESKIQFSLVLEILRISREEK